MKKIIIIFIIGMFFITSIGAASSFIIEESETNAEQSFAMTLSEYCPEISLSEIVDFEISVTSTNGEPISFDTYQIYTVPFEQDISYHIEGDKIIGDFIPTREGMYSLNVKITVLNNNVEKERFYFFVNPKGTGVVRYYLRGIYPTHGQPGTDPNYFDSRALLLLPPTEIEEWWCGNWVQNSPDEIPENMPKVSVLKNIDFHFWYIAGYLWPYFPSIPFFIKIKPYVGVQRHVTHNAWVNRKIRIEPTLDWEYHWTNVKFKNLNWIMTNFDSPCDSWYWLSLKIAGLGGPGTHWMTKPEQPSYADFYYKYCTNPFIKSNSNSNVVILSATSQIEGSNNVEIVLEGSGYTKLTVQMQDDSLKYYAKLNGVECDLIQNNGEITINLYLDSENDEHTLSVYPIENSYLVKNIR